MLLSCLLIVDLEGSSDANRVWDKSTDSCEDLSPGAYFITRQMSPRGLKNFSFICSRKE